MHRLASGWFGKEAEGGSTQTCQIRWEFRLLKQQHQLKTYPMPVAAFVLCAAARDPSIGSVAVHHVVGGGTAVVSRTTVVSIPSGKAALKGPS